MAKYFLLRLVLLFALSKHQQAHAERGYKKYCRVSLPLSIDDCVVNAMQAAYEGKIDEIGIDECNTRRNLRDGNKQEEGRNLALSKYQCSIKCEYWGDKSLCFATQCGRRRQLESGEAAASPEDELDAIATHLQTRELNVECENYAHVEDAMNKGIEKSLNGRKKREAEDAVRGRGQTKFGTVEIWED